jgi:hypothetical protein
MERLARNWAELLLTVRTTQLVRNQKCTLQWVTALATLAPTTNIFVGQGTREWTVSDILVTASVETFKPVLLSCQPPLDLPQT